MGETEKTICLSMDKDWSLPMIRKFIGILMDATLCTDVYELKNHTIIDCVWRKVAQEMKVDLTSLKNLWYYRLHMQLFCSEPIYLNDVKIRLINYLYKKNIIVMKDIKWQDVLSYFNGYTYQFLYRIFGYLFRTAKLKTGTSNLADNIDYLHGHFASNLTQNVEDRILPRLMYENGNVKHIDIDVEEYMALQNDGSGLSDSSSEE